MQLNVLKTIKQWKCTNRINPRYDLRLDDIRIIRENSENLLDMIFNSFVFGYAQGYKAAQAEMKREKVAG